MRYLKVRKIVSRIHSEKRSRVSKRSEVPGADERSSNICTCTLEIPRENSVASEKIYHSANELVYHSMLILLYKLLPYWGKPQT